LSGIDLTEEEFYEINALIRDLNIGESTRGERSVTNILAGATGATLREASLQVDLKLAGTFDSAKGRTVIVGEELAKNNIFKAFDTSFRDPRINISGKVVVTDGRAADLVKHLSEQEPEKAEFFSDLIESSEDATEIPEYNMHLLFSSLLDEGKDFILPFVRVGDRGLVKVDGGAIFKGDQFTGIYTTIRENMLLLLFRERMGKQAVLTSAIEHEAVDSISYKVDRLKTKTDIQQNGEAADVKLTLELGVEVIDYPPADLDEEKQVKKLNQQLSQDLTEQAKAIFEKLAEAESDVLSIGRELMAYHPEIWETIEGDEYYSKINVYPEVRVTIEGGGLII
jgi:Ger(x)C family germination protein